MAQTHLGESSLSEIIRQFCERADEFLCKANPLSFDRRFSSQTSVEFELLLAGYDHLLDHGRHLKSHFGTGEESKRSLADLSLQSVLVRQMSALIRGRSRLVIHLKNDSVRCLEAL